jgi:hypothetical protein
MQIGGECIEYLLVNMVLGKKNFKNAQIRKDTFSCPFAWEWAKQIPIWKCPRYNILRNLKLPYLNWL